MRTWIVPVDPDALVAAFLDHFADDSSVFVEGEIAASEFPDSSRRASVVVPHVGREAPDATHFVVLTLSPQTASHVTRVLLREGRLTSDVAALQIVHGGIVRFLAGDNFHHECVSVEGVSPEFLSSLFELGVAKPLRPAPN